MDELEISKVMRDVFGSKPSIPNLNKFFGYKLVQDIWNCNYKNSEDMIEILKTFGSYVSAQGDDNMKVKSRYDINLKSTGDDDGRNPSVVSKQTRRDKSANNKKKGKFDDAYDGQTYSYFDSKEIEIIGKLKIMNQFYKMQEKIIGNVDSNKNLTKISGFCFLPPRTDYL